MLMTNFHFETTLLQLLMKDLVSLEIIQLWTASINHSCSPIILTATQ